MARVTLTLDPMPSLRKAKVDQINKAFSAIAALSLHQDQAHAQKREWAATLDDRLKPESDLRGTTVADLAALILTKPDDIAEREARRQRLLAAIAAAKTPTELDAIKGILD